MLDVHPPHSAVHGWRDLFIHLFTITIGLLIAVSLEGMVEAMHHRHLVHEARENIREEIKSNRQILADDRKSLESHSKAMQQNIAILNALKSNPKQAPREIKFDSQWSSPVGAAWQTARDTGALALMPYDFVEGYSTLYVQQELVNQQALVYLHDVSNASTPLKIDPSIATMAPEQIHEMLHGCAMTLTDTEYLEFLMDNLDRIYSNALAEQP